MWEVSRGLGRVGNFHPLTIRTTQSPTFPDLNEVSSTRTSDGMPLGWMVSPTVTCPFSLFSTSPASKPST
jgi:hypothetical protein